jgi:heme/copper-type cytochrome/quinol oxidase subunit 3
MTRMETRPTIDARRLPGSALDARAPVWWGNVLIMVIESTSIAMLIASYFYVRQNYTDWPPPQVDRQPAIKNPVPDLPLGTLSIGLLLASCVPMVWTERAARRQSEWSVKAGLVILGVLGLIVLVLRFYEFPAVKFTWKDNAYASIVWALLLFNLLYVLMTVGEAIVVGVWTFMHGLDEKHVADVTLTAGTWYWTAGIGLVIYLVVYWAPRIL